ncbi:MAG TPA: hypothetical protein VKB28_15215 [Solirubrobacteraceae bacterium]|nr:hypothetical protein [Solirubrobacteraceae bacterium]
MSEDFISGLHADLVEAMDRYERRTPRGRLAAGRYPRLLKPATLARVAAGAALIVALVALVVAVPWESDVERPAAPPGKKVAATDVEHGVRFSLDGRVLTVQLLPDSPGRTVRTVSGAEISATCGTNVTTSPGDPRSETTLFRRWPAGQTTLSYHFPRDVSSWCRLDRQPVGIVAFVRFPGASPGAKGPIAEIGNNWARLFASSAQACNAYTRGTACEGVTCRGCEPSKKAWQWAEAHLTATVQKTAVSGDRAAAKLSNGNVLQLRRSASGEWLIDGFGEFGLPAELRRKL